MGLPEKLLDVLHLNFECEAKYLSRLGILIPLHQGPHSEPHSCTLQETPRAVGKRSATLL